MQRPLRRSLAAALVAGLLGLLLAGTADAGVDPGPADQPKSAPSSPLTDDPPPAPAPAADVAVDPVPALHATAAAEGTVDVLVSVDGEQDPTTAVASTLGTDPTSVHTVTPDVAAVTVTPDELAALDAADDVVAITEDRPLELLLTESIPRVGADVTRNNGQTGAGRRIAVIDSGIDRDHPAFAGAISTEEACFIANTAVTDPCPGGLGSAFGVGAAAECTVPKCGHGTHVASIAAGRGGGGTAQGVAPGAQLIPIRIFYSTDSTNNSATSGDLLAALEYVRQRDLVQPIDVVNLSLGYGVVSAGTCDGLDSTFTNMFNQLRAQDVAIVVASGNDGGSAGVSFPACIDAATAVAATLDTSDDVAALSDTGSPVALAAPGTNITAAWPGGGTNTQSGTSMAAPHVAGGVALLRGRYGNQSVGWIEERLWDTGVHVTDPTSGLQLRRIDVAAALALRAPAPAPPADVLWAVTNQGRVFWAGWALDHGESPVRGWGERVVAGTATRSGLGYWLVTNWGRVHAYGDARFAGDMAGQPLNKPISAMTTTASGQGYWLLAEDGGIFSFGDAQFYGSTGNLRLNAPVTDLALTSTGAGYWLTAKDGGVFSFGDAQFYGSTGNLTLNKPVVSIAAGPTQGYWLVALDGGVFAFGVPFHGSLPGAGVRNETGYRVRATAGGRGYYIATAQGGVYPFGQATDYGGTGPLAPFEELVDVMIPPA